MAGRRTTTEIRLLKVRVSWQAGRKGDHKIPVFRYPFVNQKLKVNRFFSGMAAYLCFMWKSFSAFFLAIFVIAHLAGFSQGSWFPAGLDPEFPRTLLDSSEIPIVRQSLTEPEMNSLYQSIWSNATGMIPPGNTSDIDRINRALLAKETAFCYLMDRKPLAGGILPLSGAERDTLLNRTLYLLQQLNTDVNTGSGLTFYNPWQYRSKELIAALIAYDLLLGADVPATTLGTVRSKLITFAGNLYQKAMASYIFGLFTFFTYQFNNHSIMTSSALGVAAVVLNDNSSSNPNYQPLNWFNTALFNLDNTLWVENGTYPRVSDPDTLAGYAEGPHYLRYGFENAFPFLRAMGNFLPDDYHQVTFGTTTRLIRNPWYDERYDRLYDWMNRIRMPDGSCPAIHDTYMEFGTKIMALSGKPQFNLPNPGYTANDPFVRCQYIATHVAQGAYTDSLFQSLPAAGSLVFRSSWQTGALYMHFIGKHGIALTGAKSHHQGDASSFTLGAYGKLLAIDPGYPGASLASTVNKASDHNLILVNNTGPLPPTGESVSTSTNNAWIEHCFDTPLLDYGEVRTGYSGASITRRNLFIRNRYFILGDFIQSSASGNFTFQLHGNGLFGSVPGSITGAFFPDFDQQGAIWTRDTVSLLARVIAPGQASGYSFSTDSMAIDNGFRHYSKMHVHKNQVSSTFFQSALIPYCSAPLQTIPIFPDPNCTAFRITGEGFSDLVFCTGEGTMVVLPADSTGMGSQVSGNGRINLYSETTSGAFSMAFLQEGDTLLVAQEFGLFASKPVDFCWTQTTPDLIHGFVSTACTMVIQGAGPVHAVSGPANVIAFDSLTSRVIITFTQGGQFCFASTALSWIWNGSAGPDWHENQNWELEGYPAVHGIPSAVGDVIIPGETAIMPVVYPSATAECYNLTIQSNGSLTIAEGATLTVSGMAVLHFE